MILRNIWLEVHNKKHYNQSDNKKCKRFHFNIYLQGHILCVIIIFRIVTENSILFATDVVDTS